MRTSLTILFIFLVLIGRGVTFAKNQPPLDSKMLFIKIAQLKDQNQYKEAISLCYDFLIDNPSNAEIRLELAMLLKDYGDLDQAGIELEHLLTLTPQNSDIYNMLSDICLARKQYRQAIAYLERGLKHSTDGNPDVKEKLGILYYFVGEYKKSQLLLDEVVRLNPMREQSHLFLGHDYFELKEYDDALKEYQWILANSQTDEMHYARLYLSRTYSRLAEEAKLFHGHNGEYQRKLAEQELEQVLLILPNDSRVHFSIANTLVDLDRFAEARSYFEMVVEDDPDFAAALNNLSWLLSTATDTSFREPKRSLDYADKSVRLTNAQKDIYLDTLAEAYYKDGQYDKAIEVIHEAILINPLNDYYHQQLDRFQKAKRGYQQKTGGRIFLQAVNPGSIYSF